jgi:hypothetical protein
MGESFSVNSAADKTGYAISGDAVRFLFAVDLRLDTPFAGGPGIGAVLSRLRDIPFEALRRLVDCALERRVDCVLLAGRICDAAMSSITTRFFLIEQIDRLAAAGIVCYVGEGEADFLFRENAVHPLVEFFDAFPACREGATVSTGTLQGRSMDEAGPRGAWLVSLKRDGTFEREFLELDALRLQVCEEDIDDESAPPLSVRWTGLKERLRLEANGRSVLVRLRLKRKAGSDLLYEDDRCINLMQTLNAGEELKKNFVVIDYIDYENLDIDQEKGYPSGDENFCGEDDLVSDFRQEIAAFTSRIDSRVALFDVLKERGLLKRILADTPAAGLLEEITETDMDEILKDACAGLAGEIFGA